jgi:hypothetical protein
METLAPPKIELDAHGHPILRIKEGADYIYSAEILDVMADTLIRSGVEVHDDVLLSGYDANRVDVDNEQSSPTSLFAFSVDQYKHALENPGEPTPLDYAFDSLDGNPDGRLLLASMIHTNLTSHRMINNTSAHPDILLKMQR